MSFSREKPKPHIMASMTICTRSRPLSSKEKRDHGEAVCIQCIDSETFLFKGDKDEEFAFSFDKVFYEKSEQTQVYEFRAWPIVRDAVDAINGTIITYGQTGAGKKYSMEGPSRMECEKQKRGLLPRVVEGLFDCIKSSRGTKKHSLKLSMGILLYGLTEDGYYIIYRRMVNCWNTCLCVRFISIQARSWSDFVDLN